MPLYDKIVKLFRQIHESVLFKNFSNYSASEGIGGCDAAAEPPHYTPLLLPAEMLEQ